MISGLAQSGVSGGGSGSIVVWVIVLMFATIVGFWLAMLIRKRALAADEDEGSEGLTLGALRDMHARGDLDDEEYERARTAILLRSGIDPDKVRSTSGSGVESGFSRVSDPGVDLTGAPLPSSDREDDADSSRGAN